MKRFTKYPANYVRANTINRYSDVVPYEKRRYWYFTTHGYGPGSLPKDVTVLETREGQDEKGTWGDYICVDSVLNTDELRKYDLRELAPKDVKSACGKKKVSAGTQNYGKNAEMFRNHIAFWRHKLKYDAGLQESVVDNATYGDFDEVVMGSTDIFASYEEWDGYVDPEIILENSDVPNMKEAKKLADYIHQSEYTSGFATLTDFFLCFDLDELYEEMIEEEQ